MANSHQNKTSSKATPDKLQPHNIEAEEAVLGALLIDPDAIIRIAHLINPEDFYLQRHLWIYEAIVDLHQRREPPDLITLTDELERRDHLESIGGPAFLTDLVNATPTSIHVEYYARIVERTAILRRLIDGATQIAKSAYEDSEDVTEIVDQAESIIFGISSTDRKRDLRPIRQAIDSYYDRIEYLSQHQGEIIGIPTGLKDLDRLLGGLQRSDLIIMAARPGMGKTSLGLSLTLQAARKWDKRIALFSLEMSDEQLVQRLLSAETGIDSQRLRLGQIRAEEWPVLVQATTLLADTAIFIDDTPAISALELRSKARRLDSEYGIDLIIVDYLQLMRGENRNENRQQEISFISRSLKELARELNVPVIAMSQLSRAVESRHDKRPMLADLRESGCLPGDTLITLDTGRQVPISTVEPGQKIFSLNEQTLKIEPSHVSNKFCTGTKPVYKITTALGRTIRATANHKFRTPCGWLRLDQLQPQQYLAVPRPAIYYATSNAKLAKNVQTLLRHLEINATLRRVSPGDKGRDQYQVIVSGQPDWERLTTIADILQSPSLNNLAESDVYWDKIISIEPDCMAEVFDLTVPDHHNFVANNIVAHNSIEQDADVVLFIYRDEIYNPDTEFPNIAEIIVSKHRSGPTGIFSVYFKKQLAQFVDLEVRTQTLDY